MRKLSLVAKLNTVRVLISVAFHHQWPLFQLDIKNAFLNGDLQETVYMQQPPGFVTMRESQVCRLLKALYGLKQSPRAWFEKFRDDSKGIQAVKLHLNSVFQTKDLGPLRYFLGLEVVRRPDGLALSQRKYCLDLLHDTDLLLQNPEYYRRLVGKLIYLTVTRPDISFVVGIVSRYMHSPRISHLQAVERILRYLKTAPGQGPFYRTSSSAPTLVAYSDADYVGSLDDRRSTSSFCTYFGGHLVTWRSKKQAVVARSSAEAEYRAMTSVVSELTWLESLLTDLGVKLPSPALLLCDSQAAIHIAKNPVFHERTKHIEVNCHFIREKVQMKKLDLKHVPGSEQVADVLTKALFRPFFYQCLSMFGAYDLYAPACGGDKQKVEEELQKHKSAVSIVLENGRHTCLPPGISTRGPTLESTKAALSVGDESPPEDSLSWRLGIVPRPQQPISPVVGAGDGLGCTVRIPDKAVLVDSKVGSLVLMSGWQADWVFPLFKQTYALASLIFHLLLRHSSPVCLSDSLQQLAFSAYSSYQSLQMLLSYSLTCTYSYDGRSSSDAGRPGVKRECACRYAHTLMQPYVDVCKGCE
ncbi:hypothetical protein KSP39_PZI019084 [Platanthera zijinensis]|uniref:Reverse transcriptase Ty1/copia-type domain-containing protein n=1 Tax=Platanthera zijinensis TaxID=2320716 RepID=A0AAP0B231_9ASPA